MNHDDFDRDPVTDDEFFGELADMIELVDRMTRERLSGGELERRRKDIMDRVRGGATADPAGGISPDPAPDPARPSRYVLDGNSHITVRLTEWRSPTHLHQRHHGDLHRVNLGDDAVERRLGSAVAAATADAERYRDSALRRAAEIIKQAQQEADELLDEARRTLDEARRSADAITIAGERSTPGAEVSSEQDPLSDRPPTGWHLSVMATASEPARSGWLSPRFGPVDAGGATANAPSWLAEQVLRAARTAAKSPASYLPTALPNACEKPRRLRWPRILYDQAVLPGRGLNWLSSHDVTDEGIEFVGLDNRADAVLYQLKNTARANDAARQKLDRLWPARHPLVRLYLRTVGLSASASPDACHAELTAAVLAELRCAWDRGSGHLPDLYPTAAWSAHWPPWSAHWPAITAAVDNVLDSFAPELLPLAGATRRVGGRVPVLSSAQRLLFACEVEGFGRADASLQSRWQHAVRQILGEAAGQAGLDSRYWQRQRAGDGELAILPLGTSWRTVFEQLIGAVERQLDQYNRYTTDDAQLRLRVAVHEGTVAGTSGGFAGQAATMVTRLVEAPPLRQALDEHPTASMAVAVSEPVYREVTHGQAPGRSRYMQVTIPQSKGPTEGAWVFVPDGSMRSPGWEEPGAERVLDDRRPTPRRRPQGGPRQTAPA